MPKKRVLLVDDNTEVRAMVRELFETHPDFEVAGEADNGRDGVAKASNLKPDLVVLDLVMPVMTGLDAAPLLRKEVPAALLILFTAHEGREVERLARAAGIDAVVSKTQAAAQLVAQAAALLTSQKKD
jgi:DNA-binding NarL/FixJ family response regulator